MFPTMNVNHFPNGKIRKLNYVIHNPNSVEETAKILLDVFVEANTGKVEKHLRDLAVNDTEEDFKPGKEKGVGGV